MAITKRGDGWRVQWRDPASRSRKSRTFSSRKQAEAFERERTEDTRLVRAGRMTAGQASEQPYVMTVVELCERFSKHANTDYRKPDGRPTSTIDSVRMFLSPLKQECGAMAAADFGPLALKRVRDAMASRDWSRRTINGGVNLIRHVFRWGVAEEIVPAPVLVSLEAVAPLRRGRSDAREAGAIRPVPAAHIRAVRPHVSRQVWAMIELQRLTGMRPGEVAIMRACDLDTSGHVWIFTPAEHKTEHHGHERTIYLGPRAQAIIHPFLKRELNACLFSPREAESDRKAAEAKGRRRPGQPESPRKTLRTVGERYTTDSYRRAIQRASETADVPAWSPNQLRHNAATRLRREYGIDVAQTILGHRLGSSVTEVYAEANSRKARQVVAQVG